MTNNKQQTAVEWFIQELQKTRDWQRVINEANQSTSAVRDVIEQAKEMEKEQIEDAYSLSRCEWNKIISSSEYYQQTYKGGEQ
jgi:hypothetical protein